MHAALSVALFPGLLCFFSSVCILCNTQKWKSTEKSWNTYHVNDVRCTQGGCRLGGQCPTTSTRVINLRASFLLVKREYSWSCECLGSCLATEHSKMKSSTLFNVFECRPLPLHVYLTSTWRHSHDKYPRPFPFFTALLLPCTILNTNRRTKQWNEAILSAHVYHMTTIIQLKFVKIIVSLIYRFSACLSQHVALLA